jgi:hypothetical protein
MANPLFSGPTSVRDRREGLAFVLTLIFALPIASAIGFVCQRRCRIPRFGRFNFPHPIPSLEDLLAFKLAVVSQRVEVRDYQDIAAIIRSGVFLERGLGSAKAIYGSQFQPSETLKVLTYFEGAIWQIFRLKIQRCFALQQATFAISRWSR